MLFLYCNFIHRASLIDDNSYNAKLPKAQVNFFFIIRFRKIESTLFVHQLRHCLNGGLEQLGALQV